MIDHQLQRVRRELLLHETKIEASDASLPVPDIVATALQLRREAQDAARVRAGEAWQGDEAGLVFTGRFRRLGVSLR